MTASSMLAGESSIARAAPAVGSESSRRWIVRLTLLVVVLLIVEGALRKWVLPGQGRWLYFVRDPVVVAIYATALVGGWWPRRSALLGVGIAFAVVGFALGVVQTLGAASQAETQALLAIYGWRNYFLYVPLMFVIGATFGAVDLDRLARLLLLLAVPVAALVFLQFFSPAGAKINVGISDDAALQFHGLGLIGTRTRPMGPFTSDIGLREFTVTVLAIAMALWLTPAGRRRVALPIVALGTAGACVALALSGSRGAMLHCGLVIAGAFACAIVVKPSAATARALVIPPVLAILGLVLYPVLFPEGYEAFVGRWTAAAAVESRSFEWGIVGRWLYGFVDFVDLIGQVPLLGYGIGLAGNASLLLGFEIEGFEGWAETDWARHMVDLGPIFGSLFIVYRAALVAMLAATAFRALRERAEALAALLFVYAGLVLFSGQLTGQGSVNGFGWVVGGLVLAAARASSPFVRSDVVAVPTAPRFPNLLR